MCDVFFSSFPGTDYVAFHIAHIDSSKIELAFIILIKTVFVDFTQSEVKYGHT